MRSRTKEKTKSKDQIGSETDSGSDDEIMKKPEIFSEKRNESKGGFSSRTESGVNTITNSLVHLPIHMEVEFDEYTQEKLALTVHPPSGCTEDHCTMRVVEDGRIVEIGIYFPDDFINAALLFKGLLARDNPKRIEPYHPMIQAFRKKAESLTQDKTTRPRSIARIPVPRKIVPVADKHVLDGENGMKALHLMFLVHDENRVIDLSTAKKRKKSLPCFGVSVIF